MKTTIEIPDVLLRQAQELAHSEKTTLRSLVEEGLRKAIAARQSEPRFVLRDASIEGEGLQPEFHDASWSQIRDAAYGLRA